jgi:hypothetical protein
MSMLSSTAWVVHDLGLASAFGGALFGKLALEPAVREINEQDRSRVEDRAWRRYSVWSTLGLGTAGLTWLVGRTMLSGREVSGTARGLTLAKDALVGTSVGLIVAQNIVGRMLGRARQERAGTEYEYDRSLALAHKADKLQTAVDILGNVQLGLVAGIMAVTSVLAMESGKSLRFGLPAKRLP